MIWISIEQIAFLHDELIKETGGSSGLRDGSLLESAILSPLQTFDGKDLFPTLIDKAVRLACGLIQNHPFIDGNKRIGAHAMLVILSLNGISLRYTQKELAEIFLQLAANLIGFDELKEWIYFHLVN